MKLTYDNRITIASAPSVFGPWQNVTMSVSDLYTKLAIPVRGEESHTAYMAWPKKQQDKAKNVGGYVGGSLVDGIRKNGHCADRCLVTLDIDRMAKDSTNLMIGAMQFKLFCSWCVYSTRKHSSDAPRLRVVIPLAKPISPELYEPLARAIGKRIDPAMNSLDRTTFQAIRCMYYPSCSADSDFVFQYHDAPLLDAEVFLSEFLPEWQDVTQWPLCPDEESIRVKNVDKAQDPCEKEGVVGAFCRTYNIHEAIEKFLPDVYEVCGEDRYTYTNGTSTGGAIVYQDGKFLYSHHATDPCCDQIVNAFDLVRIHKFRNLDYKEKDDTPPTKLPSYKAMCDFAMEDSTVSALVIKERGDRLKEESSKLDEFVEPKEGEIILNPGKSARNYNWLEPGVKGDLSDSDVEELDPKKKVNTEMVLAAMKGSGIRVGINIITGRLSVAGLDSRSSIQEAANTVCVALSDYFRNVCKINVSPAQVVDYVAYIADRNRFNPVANWLDNGGEWDGYDRISDLYEILGIDGDEEENNGLYRIFVRKWLIQCIAMLYNEDTKPVCADGALVLQGAQGAGKTLFFQTLAVCDDWFADGLSIDMNNKDSLLRATSCWIGELGELDSTLKREQSALKAFITGRSDNIRAPYARSSTVKVRRTSFCGTVNPEDYLRDETGSRRFWTVHVEDIDCERLLAMSEEYKRQLWLQVRGIWRADKRSYHITGEERIAMEQNNMQYTQKLQYQEEVEAMMDFDLPEEEWRDVPATTLAALIPGVKVEARALGKILKAIAKDNKDDRMQTKKGAKGKRFWHVPLRSVYGISEE